MIVTVRHLQAVHYYYFIMGIFSLSNAILFGLGTPFSLVFIAFYIINSGISWYIAFVSRRKMSEFMIVQSLGYFVNHTIVAVLTVICTILLWISAISVVSLLHMIILVNYFVLIMAGLWYGFTRARFVKGLFTIYDSYVFKKSKNFILKLKRAHRGFFGREIVSEESIDEYKYGTIKEVDDNMLSAWRNKGKLQYALECLGRIELSIARQGLNSLRGKIAYLRMLPGESRNKALIKRAEGDAQERQRSIMEYEKAFYRKTGESEFL